MTEDSNARSRHRTAAFGRAGDEHDRRTSARITEPFSLEKVKNSDVLLNYAAIDDQPLLDGRPGWVSQLHRNLEVRIEQLSGEKVTIARLPESAVSHGRRRDLLEQLPQAKAMISVVSPPFLKSDICRKKSNGSGRRRASRRHRGSTTRRGC